MSEYERVMPYTVRNYARESEYHSRLSNLPVVWRNVLCGDLWILYHMASNHRDRSQAIETWHAFPKQNHKAMLDRRLEYSLPSPKLYYNDRRGLISRAPVFLKENLIVVFTVG